MKNKFKFLALAIMALLSVNVWGAFTPLSLPKEWDASDGKSAYTEALGCTLFGLGSDYSSAPKLKFDTQGDYMIIQVADAPDEISFNIKGNSVSGTYSFRVQESDDGSSYTDALNITQVTGSSANKSASLKSSTRYIKLIYTTKASGNMGVGGISITKATSGGGGDWELVTDASTLKVGDILVIGCSSKGATAGDISSSIMAKKTSTFNAAGTKITALDEGTVELTLGGTSGAWTFANSSKQLLGATAVKKVAWGSGTTTWSISISNGAATIQNGTSSYGRFLYNANSGQERFTPYATSTSTSTTMLLPQLYRKPSSCTAPTINPDLSETEVVYTKGATATALSITASGTDVTYQWYSNTTKSTSGATTLTGQTLASYTPSTATTGTTYYYCIASSSTCNTTSKIAKITVNEASYSISYNLDGGTRGTNQPTSGTIGTAFAVSPPTKEHYTFTGWQVTSDLNTSTAKWGPGSALLTGTITSSTQKCIINTTNDIYFLDLGANGASVTLTATWEEKAKVTVTLLNNNVPVNAGGFDAQGQKQYYSDETLGTLPTLNSGVACDETSTTFMGWTTEQITTKRDYAPDFVTPSTPVTDNMTLRAVWARAE